MSRAYVTLPFVTAVVFGAACEPPVSHFDAVGTPRVEASAAAQSSLVAPKVALEFGDDGVTLAAAAWPRLHFSTREDGSKSVWRNETDVFLGRGLAEEASCHLREITIGHGGAATPSTEAWCPRGDSVEHAFQFGARPSSHDLAVAIEVSNGPAATSDGGGVSWRTEGGLALRYGKAAWIDARGRRFPVDLAYAERGDDQGVITLSVTPDVLDASEYPAVLDPTLSAWTRVAEPVLRPSERFAQPVVASGLGDDAAIFLQTFDDPSTSTWVRFLANGTVSTERPAPFPQNVNDAGRHVGTNGTFFSTYHSETDQTVAAHHMLLTSGVWAYRNVIAGPRAFAYAVGPTSTGYRVYRRSLGNSPFYMEQRDVLSDGTTVSSASFAEAIAALPQAGFPRKVLLTGADQQVVITSYNTVIEAHVLDGAALTATVDISAAISSGTYYDFIDADVAPDGTVAMALVHTGGAALVTLVGNTTAVFDLEMSPLSHVTYGHGKFLVVAHDRRWRVFTPGVGMGPIQTPDCPSGNTSRAAAHAGGFVLAFTCVLRPVAINLDPMGDRVAPGNELPLLLDEQNQEPLALLPRDADSAWAVWRDDRDAPHAVFARAVDWSGQPVAATVPTGDAVGVSIDAPTDVSAVKTSSAGLVLWNGGNEIAGAFSNGGTIQPVSIPFDQATQTIPRPLIIAGEAGAIVREQIATCPSPPCAAMKLVSPTHPSLVVPGDWRDVYDLKTASGDNVSWVAAAVELTDGTFQLQALSVNSFTDPSAFVTAVIAAPTNVTAVDGMAVDADGTLAIVWQTGDGPSDAQAHFSLVAGNGAVTTVDLARIPAGAGMVALRGGRGFLHGDTVFRAAGQSIEVLPELSIEPSNIAGATDGNGNVVVARGIVADGEPRRFEVASVFVGDAIGSPCASADQCGSSFCQEGVCCEAKCGVCERCDQAEPGRCEAAGAGDDDTCFGNRTCTEAGDCMPANGQSCVTETDCASGFCVDGVCCDTACDDACGMCQAGIGVCTLRDCGAYQCEGGGVCKSECETGVDCAPGYACGASGRCITQDEPVVVDDGACGCHLVGSPADDSRSTHGWALLAALAMVWRRRKNWRAA